MTKSYAITRDILESDKSIEISQDEFESLKRAYSILELSLTAEEMFDAIAQNYLELESDMLTKTLQFALAGLSDEMEPSAIRRLLNRRISNLLSAVKTYQDHLLHAAKGMFNEDNLYIEIQSTLSHYYDNFQGYRLMEALRNHSQHHGLPVHSILFSTDFLREQENTPIKKTISPMVDIEILKSNKKFKASVLKEIESLEKRLSLKPFVREYITCLAKTHNLFKERVAELCTNSNETIKSAAAKLFEDPYRDIGLYAVQFDGKSWEDKVSLNSGLGRYREYLLKRNVHFIFADASFVSGEHQE